MGTECNLHLYAGTCSMAEEVSRLAISEVRRIEQRYSRYQPDSILSRINCIAQTGGSIAVDEETAGLLNYAYACYTKSDGLFDITSGLLRKAWDFTSNRLPEQETIDNLLPKIGLDKVLWEQPTLTFLVPGMELDFGGMGKEYAVDRAAEICISQGIQHGLVELGGDITVIGPHPNNAPWLIGIQNPVESESVLATIEIRQGALASSGDYERCIKMDEKRYGHIINPLTGWPAQGLSSVSVIAGQCMVAGTISTIAMLKGSAGAQWLSGMGMPYLWIGTEMNNDRKTGCSLNFVIPSSSPACHL
ncbi:MAG: FAD:protein FMN transferase [Nitrospira sp.]|nr:FAD:protein FMN transferase [Nitrospira sp.]